MSDNEELDPALANALRDIPPAEAALRDAHIAAALAEMAPSRRSASRRMRILASVAAATVLAVGGLSFVNRDSNSPGTADGTETTRPPKTGASCADTFSGLSTKAEHSESITHQGVEYALLFRDGAVDVYVATPPCTSVGTLDYSSSLSARANGTASFAEQSCNGQDVVHQFTNADDNYSLAALHTENGISVRFAGRCGVDLATLALP